MALIARALPLFLPIPVWTAPEEWRPIPGSEGLYSVSSLGRVRSEPTRGRRTGRQRGRTLKCSLDSKGYRQFAMSLTGGRRIRMKVHRAVALAFLGPRPPGTQINHKSGDKLDNSVANLEYVTCRQNIRHAWRKGLYTAEHCRGQRNPFAKLSPGQVRDIRSLASGTSLSELARQFGVSKTSISQVINRKTWKHVG